MPKWTEDTATEWTSVGNMNDDPALDAESNLSDHNLEGPPGFRLDADNIVFEENLLPADVRSGAYHFDWNMDLGQDGTPEVVPPFDSFNNARPAAADIGFVEYPARYVLDFTLPLVPIAPPP